MSVRQFRRAREREERRELRRRRGRAAALTTGVAAGAAILAAPAAQAANYTVTNTLDADPMPPAGSLRDALDQANASVGVDDTITFQAGLSGQITLVSELVISDPVSIQGPGAQTLTVSGGNDTRVFVATPGQDGDVLISGLTIADGGVENSVGAGILHLSGTLTVSDSVISGNTVESTEDLLGWGGGILSDGDELNIVNSTINDNAVIYEPGDSRAVTGDAGFGGGVYLDDSVTTILNSTISGNGALFGGGIATGDDGADVSIENSTIAENSALDAGGGIYRKYAEGADVNLISTIVANNSAGEEGPDIAEENDGEGSSFVAGFSLIEDTSGATIVETDPNVTGQDPQLGGLLLNGGTTRTHLPAATSPAIDKGNAEQLSSDQRGLTRTSDNAGVTNATGGDGTDIGSVEVQSASTGDEPASRRQCLGENATIVGTIGKDVIVGTDGRDVIRGMRGNDVIKSLGGNDIVCGDKGNDKIRSGDGSDTVRGGNHRDRIKGGTGDDVLRGGSAFDHIFGQAGDDQLFGGAPRGRTQGGGGSSGGPGNVCEGGGGSDSADGCETVRGVP